MLKVAVHHRYPNFDLRAAFEAQTPGITVLFGPSGAGKSTVLAAVAGLLRADQVRVELDGEPLHRKRPERRRIGMVFQDGRLFPHMTVEQNLTYGLFRAPKGRIGLADAVDLLGLHDLRRRRPATLSGGERQRVAIGRALLAQPRLLLMDEPLSSLDAARRDEILPYLGRLRDAARIPILYVTHAIEEMARLADTVVLMQGGQVLAAGLLTDIAARVDLPLAARDDAGGVLNGYVASHDPERRLTTVACGGQVYLVPLMDLPERTALRLRVPAREVILALDEPRAISVNNIIPGVVCAVAEDLAHHAALVEIDVGGGQLLARVTLDAAERLRLRAGSRVLALIKSMAVEVLLG